MPKKFYNQHCVYCLNYFEELTKDHIFPKSWYPDSTPKDIEKWVAPACFECNNRLGKIEEELYKKIAVCVGFENIAASGISEDVIRKLIPLSTEKGISRMRKGADLEKIIKDSIHTEDVPKGLMRNFGPTVPGKSMVLRVSVSKLLDPFANKLVRGLEFKLKNKLIKDDRKIKTIHPVVRNIINSELEKLNAFLRVNGIKVNRGPGFTVHHAEDIYGSTLYHVVIWGKFEIWIAVSGSNIKT